MSSVQFASSKKFEQLYNMCKNHSPGKNLAVFIHGNIGTGKTHTVKTISEQLGRKLIIPDQKLDKEELNNIHKHVQSESFDNIIYLFDHVETIKHFDILDKILRDSRYPIFIFSHDEYLIPNTIKKRCQVFRTQQPNLTNLVAVVNQVGEELDIEPNFSRIIPGVDFRTAIHCALYGSAPFKEQTIFEQVNNIMTGKNDGDKLIGRPFIYENISLIWLVDNAPSFFYGRRMIEQIELIAKADSIKDNKILEYGHKSNDLYAKTTMPNYVKRSYMMKKNDSRSK